MWYVIFVCVFRMCNVFVCYSGCVWINKASCSLVSLQQLILTTGRETPSWSSSMFNMKQPGPPPSITPRSSLHVAWWIMHFEGVRKKKGGTLHSSCMNNGGNVFVQFVWLAASLTHTLSLKGAGAARLDFQFFHLENYAEITLQLIPAWQM